MDRGPLDTDLNSNFPTRIMEQKPMLFHLQIHSLGILIVNMSGILLLIFTVRKANCALAWTHLNYLDFWSFRGISKIMKATPENIYIVGCGGVLRLM